MIEIFKKNISFAECFSKIINLNIFFMKHFNKFLILLAFIGLSAGAFAQNTYTIILVTGQGYRVFDDSELLYSGSSMQAAIDFIKGNANGADCTIQLGGGGAAPALNLGSGSNTLVTFNGGTSGAAWGTVTLTGKATSASTANGIIRLENVVSINCEAELTATAKSLLIYNASTGATVNITGGTVSATTGYAVWNYFGTVNISGGTVAATTTTGIAVYNELGTVNISGGNVSATTGVAIWNYDTGKINISGGTVSATTGVAILNSWTGKITISETAKVTSKNSSDDAPKLTGTIVLADAGTTTDCRLEITGGTVENTLASNSDMHMAIVNLSTGAVNISDGEISTSSGLDCAVYNYSSGAINISGGEILGGACAISNQSGTVNISGGEISIRSAAIGTINAAIMSGGSVNISGGKISASATGTGAVLVIAVYNVLMLTISGGEISASTTGLIAYAVANVGIANISGGEISASATGGVGAVTVLDAGFANISGGKISTNSTIGVAVDNQENTTIISGGEIENTSDYGIAINNSDEIEVIGGTVRSSGGDAIVNGSTTGKVTIGGSGMVIALEGYAVNNSGTLTISNNSILFAYGENDTEVINGDYTQQNNAIVAAWNNKTNITTYAADTNNDIFVNPAAASALWAKQGGNSGIAVKYGSTNGFIPVADVTVTGGDDGIVETGRATSVQVYPNPTTGELRIENGELRIESVEIFDVYGRNVGAKFPSKNLEGWQPQADGVVFNISHLQSGIYFVKISTDEGVVVKKVLKE